MDMRAEPTIELHIEELVLHGFARRDRETVGHALEDELTRLLREQGVPAAWLGGGEIDQINVGQINLPRGLRGAAVGVQVAQRIYRGVGQ